MTDKDTSAEFQRRALEGDGAFAIAFALMRLREDLCFGDGTGDRVQGVFEKLAMEVADIGPAIRDAVDQ